MIKRTYDLENRLIDFVLKIDQIVELLPNTRLAKSSQTAKSKLPKRELKIEYSLLDIFLN